MSLLNSHDKKMKRQRLLERARADRIYQDFMIGYVKRINEATLNVTIGGVRIGSAKYSRLAQINLKSRIITFSRFAVDNVPESGRRYLVLHELAHVKEPSHNKNFWQIIARYEPNYKQVERELERCFKLNVQNEAAVVDPTGQDLCLYSFFDNDDSDTGIVCGGSDDEDCESEVYEKFIS